MYRYLVTRWMYGPLELFTIKCFLEKDHMVMVCLSKGS